MNKIKVAFFSDVLERGYDGALRTMYHIIDRMPKESFEFLFICAVPPKEDIGHDVVVVPNLTIPFNKDYKVALPQLATFKLNQALKNFNPDLIHISTPSPLGHFGLNYGKQNKLPVTSIYHTHFISYIEYYLRKIPALIPAVHKIIARNIASFYNQCTKVFVPTTEMIKDLKKCNVRTDNMIIWPRGLDKQLFSPLKRDAKYMSDLVKNESPNVLFASRLVWEKNLETLIEVYNEFENRAVPVNIIIAGDGAAKSKMQALMPNAIFTGKVNQNELATLYASSDVFIFPSVSETYGNVVVEAMSSGLPCVLADGGGSKSFIDHGRNGFLCSPNNAGVYVDRAMEILQDKDLKNQFVSNGLDYVKDMDWDILVASFYSQLSDLVHTKRSSIAA